MSKNYFTQETEDAIVAYNTSTDFEKKVKYMKQKFTMLSSNSLKILFIHLNFTIPK